MISSMRKAMDQINREFEHFTARGLDNTSLFSEKKARDLASFQRFTGAMEEGIRRSKESRTNHVVGSETKHSAKFEEGIVEYAPWTPLLQRWADEKAGIVLNNRGITVNFSNKMATGFMKQSIPNELQTRDNLDAAIRVTLKGGVING